MKKCYHNHQPLTVKFKGNDKPSLLHGGNGYTPAVRADYYVDLNPREDSISPYTELKSNDGGVYFNFPIVNMKAPNRAALDDLVTRIIRWLKKGHSVHVGCIGGHGRTGLVLCAVAYQMTKDPKVITMVREQYCYKAVESKVQMDFLNLNYGIHKLEPRYGSKEWWQKDL